MLKIYGINLKWIVKEPDTKSYLILLYNDKIKIFLTNDFMQNLVDIQVEDDFQTKQYEEILNIILKELLYDKSENISNRCKIDSILYEFVCTDVSEYNTLHQKYKYNNDNFGVKSGNIIEDKSYKNIAYDEGGCLLISDYSIAKCANTDKRLDVMSTNAISYLTYSDIYNFFESNYLNNLNLLETISTLQKRAYDAFKMNLRKEYKDTIFKIIT